MKSIIFISLLLSTLTAGEYTTKSFMNMATDLGWNFKNCSYGTALASSVDHENESLTDALNALTKNKDTNISQVKFNIILHDKVVDLYISAICKKQYSK